MQVAGPAVEFGKALIEPSVLAFQHVLNLSFIERIEYAGNIGAEFFGDHDRILVAAMAMRIEQSCKEFVPAIKRDPATIQIEAPGPDVATANFVENQLSRLHIVASPACKSTDEPIRALRLAERQLSNDVANALNAFGVIGLRMHQRK